MKTRPYDLVVFDWDGTIFDTTALIAEGIRFAARELGLAVPAFEAASTVIGLGWQDALRRAVPDLAYEDYPKFGEIFRRWYIPNEARLTLFPGTRRLIEGLHAEGLQLAVATGKSRPGLDRVLEQTGLAPYFVTTRTPDECRPKPNPDMLEEIGIETGVEAARTVMIGDTTHDLFMARDYGCDGIAMLQGAQSASELDVAPAVARCRNTVELAAALGFPELVTPEMLVAERAAREER